MGFEPVLVRWPPLRLARLRLEPVSVVVVCPRFSRDINDEEEDEVKTLGRAVALDVHLQFCEVAIVEAGALRAAGRIETTPERLELFGGAWAERIGSRSRCVGAPGRSRGSWSRTSRG
jgi:transposase